METLNYNDKIFVSSSNTENGEVDEEIIFHYHQIDGYIWAEYYGGIIIRGFLVGYIDNNGILHFNYEHINNVKVIRTGKCESTPEIMGYGRIKLREKWEWTNGDKSKGESIVIERR